MVAAAGDGDAASAAAAPELSLLGPGAAALVFDGVAPARPTTRGSTAKAERPYAVPTVDKKLVAAALKPPAAEDLRVFGTVNDLYAPSEAEHAAAAVLQRRWRARRFRRAAAAARARRVAALSAAAAAFAHGRYGAAGALRRWAVAVRAALAARKAAEAEAEYARKCDADRASIYTDRLRSLSAARTAAPDFGAACPLCPRAAAPAAPAPALPACSGGLRVTAREFVPHAVHITTPAHLAAAEAFAAYEAAYVRVVCPALSAADAVTFDDQMDARRTAILAELKEIEDACDWTRGAASVAAAGAAMRAAADAALRSEEQRAHGFRTGAELAELLAPDAEEDEWEDLSRKQRSGTRRSKR